jgi:hypothetical protein
MTIRTAFKVSRKYLCIAVPVMAVPRAVNNALFLPWHLLFLRKEQLPITIRDTLMSWLIAVDRKE